MGKWQNLGKNKKKQESLKIKEYIKSFGRMSIAPPTRVAENKKKYNRSKQKQELRRILKYYQEEL